MPCAQVLAQQCEPTSTENQTVVAPERAEGSSVTRTTLSEASDFETGPTHAKSESSPASITNVCTRVHSSNTTSARTPAASRKSHRVPNVSHERLRPMRRHARVPKFDFDDSAPHLGSPVCRCVSEQATFAQAPASRRHTRKDVLSHQPRSPVPQRCAQQQRSSNIGDSMPNLRQQRHPCASDRATLAHPFAARPEMFRASRCFKWRV